MASQSGYYTLLHRRRKLKIAFTCSPVRPGSKPTVGSRGIIELDARVMEIWTPKIRGYDLYLLLRKVHEWVTTCARLPQHTVSGAHG
jgi:hypothetical protein